MIDYLGTGRLCDLGSSAMSPDSKTKKRVPKVIEFQGKRHTDGPGTDDAEIADWLIGEVDRGSSAGRIPSREIAQQWFKFRSHKFIGFKAGGGLRGC